MNIPKIIHYCWFGKGPLDEKAISCIDSWKKFFPDYKIIEWNEDNYDINANDFIKNAYQNKKWAFVSDVARLDIMYKYGGIYFDTDVEVIKSYTDILNVDSEGFVGFETTNQIATGLGFGMQPGNPLIKEILDVYNNIDFNQYINDLPSIACTVLTTEIFKKYGLSLCNSNQLIQNISVLSSEYFSPIDYYTGKFNKTALTHSIHWYNASWQSQKERDEFQKFQKIYRFIGKKNTDNLYGIISCIKNEGFFSYIKSRFKKIIKK